MHGISGKRFSWLVSGSAQFDPYASTSTTYSAPRRAAGGAPQTLADKLEDLVQSAYGQGDRETGRNLAVVLRNVLRRSGQPVPAFYPDALPVPDPAPPRRLYANDP